MRIGYLLILTPLRGVDILTDMAKAISYGTLTGKAADNLCPYFVHFGDYDAFRKASWLRQNVSGECMIGAAFVYFEHESDALLCYLKFS